MQPRVDAAGSGEASRRDRQGAAGGPSPARRTDVTGSSRTALCPREPRDHHRVDPVHPGAARRTAQESDPAGVRHERLPHRLAVGRPGPGPCPTCCRRVAVAAIPCAASGPSRPCAAGPWPGHSPSCRMSSAHDPARRGRRATRVRTRRGMSPTLGRRRVARATPASASSRGATPTRSTRRGLGVLPGRVDHPRPQVDNADNSNGQTISASSFCSSVTVPCRLTVNGGAWVSTGTGMHPATR